MIRKCWLILYLSILPLLVFSQQFHTAQPAGQTAVPSVYIPVESLNPNSDNLQLAISSRDYPVTPGDVYNLTFIMAGTPVTNTMLVESDYTINLDVLGKIDARGMTFPELKPIIELRIADAYPRSMPSLTIQTIGSFQVVITGALEETVYSRAWGLSRLHDVIREHLVTSSSTRNVLIRSVDGTEKYYDLMKAQMIGLLEENPHLKPGDVIVLSVVEKVVTVRGEVLRPGEYQMLPTEKSGEVYAFFGGITASANPDRIRVERRMGNDPVVTFFIGLSDFINGVELHNGDIITVSRKNHNQPFVIVEGGIIPQGEEREVPILMDEGDDGDDSYEAYYNRVIHPIGIGETLLDVLSDFRDSISDYADLKNGYIIREENTEFIPVDMHELLFSQNMGLNLDLRPNDRIAIPVRRPFVSVTGAVNAPGRFAYNPSENAKYYVGLAGGFDTARNSKELLQVVDQHGNKKNPLQPLEPGDTINVQSNNFWYNFNERFGPLTTAALFITSAITILNVLNTTN